MVTPDTGGKHYPLEQWLVEEEGCSRIAVRFDEEVRAFRKLLKTKLPQKYKDPLKSTPMIKHTINVQDHPVIKEVDRVFASRV